VRARGGVRGQYGSRSELVHGVHPAAASRVARLRRSHTFDVAVAVCHPGCADPADPMTLVPCDTGSAIVGSWSIDDDGLPAFDLAIDERCDDAATAYSPSPRLIRDPLHVVGDGHGLVAMAHASGGLDVYTQDRGHKWPVHVDAWRDDQNPAFPPQLGAAIGYVTERGEV